MSQDKSYLKYKLEIINTKTKSFCKFFIHFVHHANYMWTGSFLLWKEYVKMHERFKNSMHVANNIKDARILAYREILVKFQWAGAMALVTQFL